LQEKLDVLVFDGVSIFFVLSGFLIGRILIRTFSNDGVSWSVIKNFWIRRWFRTLPNYFLILSLLTLVFIVLNHDQPLGFLAEYYLFAQNLWTPHPNNFFPEAWSLSIEEWFYLLSPLLMAAFYFLFGKNLKRSLLSTAILIIIFSIFFRAQRFLSLGIYHQEQWDLLFRKQVITRLDGIMLFVGQRIYDYYVGSAQGMYYSVFSFSIVAIATLFTLPFLSAYKQGKGLIIRWVTRISLISYSLYLINLSLVRIRLLSLFNWSAVHIPETKHWMADYLFFWLASIMLSILLYKYFEKPMTGLRERYSKA